jgi:hypothetical protein
MKRNTGFPNEYVTGVEALIKPTTIEQELAKLSPEEREEAELEMQEINYYEAERQIREMDERMKNET